MSDLAHMAAVIASGFASGDPRTRPSNTTIARSSVEIAQAIVAEVRAAQGECSKPTSKGEVRR